MTETVTAITLSLDVDGHSYGEDETWTMAELDRLGITPEEIIDAYIEDRLERIDEIHDCLGDPNFNPEAYIDVRPTYVEDDPEPLNPRS